MDWTQQTFGLVLLASLIIGRAPWPVAAIMGLNFAGTVALAEAPEVVMCIDLMCFALLIGGAVRANTVAALFVTMAIFETIAHRLHLNNASIYTITDLIGYLQCGAIGGADRGMGRIYRAIRGHSAGLGDFVEGGRNPGLGLARNSQANGW